jgi:glutamate dehydrogenase
VAATVAAFAVPIARLSALAIKSPRAAEDAQQYLAQGVPHDLARKVASLDHLTGALDIAELATAHGVEVETVTEFYDEIGDRLRFAWLNERIVELPRADRWDALARNALREDTAVQERRIVEAVMTAGSFDAWANARAATIARVIALLDDVRAHASVDLATLSVALRELRALA